MTSETGGRGWGPLLSLLPVAVPVLGALAAIYLMTNTAYNKVTTLESQVVELQRTVRGQELQIKATCASLVEVETQFRASDQVRNLMHANELRTTAMLWQKTFPGSDFPTNNAYYPTIAQDHPAPCV